MRKDQEIKELRRKYKDAFSKNGMSYSEIHSKAGSVIGGTDSLSGLFATFVIATAGAETGKKKEKKDGLGGHENSLDQPQRHSTPCGA